MRRCWPVVLALALLTLTGCKTSNPAPDIPVDPIPLPQVPAQFVSDTLVVPAELQDEFAALPLPNTSEFWTFDPTQLEGEARRAGVYWRFSHPRTVGNSFWLILNATDRDGAQQFAENLAAGWELEIEESYYVAAEQRAYYDVYRSDDPRFTLGETAWLAEWLLLNYLQYVVDFRATIFFSHNEGGGGGI